MASQGAAHTFWLVLNTETLSKPDRRGGGGAGVSVCAGQLNSCETIRHLQIAIATRGHKSHLPLCMYL